MEFTFIRLMEQGRVIMDRDHWLPEWAIFNTGLLNANDEELYVTALSQPLSPPPTVWLVACSLTLGDLVFVCVSILCLGFFFCCCWFCFAVDSRRYVLVSQNRPHTRTAARNRVPVFFANAASLRTVGDGAWAAALLGDGVALPRPATYPTPSRGGGRFEPSVPVESV